MATSKTIGFSIEALRADDPRLPIARWHTFGQLVGTATGGAQSITIQPSQSDDLLYSVENVNIKKDSTGAENFHVNIETGSRVIENNVLEFYVGGAMLNILGAAGWSYSERIILPRYILRNQGDVVWSVTVEVANALNMVMNVSAWGYQWMNKAFLMNGGPIRPGEMLY